MANNTRLLEQQRDKVVHTMSEIYLTYTRPTVIIEGDTAEFFFEWNNKDMEEVFVILKDSLLHLNTLIVQHRNMIKNSRLIPEDRLGELHRRDKRRKHFDRLFGDREEENNIMHGDESYSNEKVKAEDNTIAGGRYNRLCKELYGSKPNIDRNEMFTDTAYSRMCNDVKNDLEAKIEECKGRETEMFNDEDCCDVGK